MVPPRETTAIPPLPTPEELRERLETLRVVRGFLLPHHGAMAAFAPDLHTAYNQMYAALTLTDRHLSPIEKETVWLAILIAVREGIGTHHVDLFRKHGGTTTQANAVIQLTGYAGAATAFAFVDQHWSAEFPGLDGQTGYLDGMRRLCADALDPALGNLALAAVHAALGQDWGVAAHIRAAYADGMSEDKLAEAISLIIWPCGVNRFVEACTVWHELMHAGRVTPSARYQAWADMPGQGAFAPARSA